MDARTWIKQKVGIQLFIPHRPTASSRQGAVREEAVYLVDRICGSQAVDPERSWVPAFRWKQFGK